MWQRSKLFHVSKNCLFITPRTRRSCHLSSCSMHSDWSLIFSPEKHQQEREGCLYPFFYLGDPCKSHAAWFGSCLPSIITVPQCTSPLELSHNHVDFMYAFWGRVVYIDAEHLELGRQHCPPLHDHIRIFLLELGTHSCHVLITGQCHGLVWYIRYQSHNLQYVLQKQYPFQILNPSQKQNHSSPEQ